MREPQAATTRPSRSSFAHTNAERVSALVRWPAGTPSACSLDSSVVRGRAALGQPPAPPAATAPPPDTDIYELPFDGSVPALKTAKPQPVATDRGYENQPFFTPDGRGILFTANRDGKQTDIYEFDRTTRRAPAARGDARGRALRRPSRPMVRASALSESRRMAPSASGSSIAAERTRASC